MGSAIASRPDLPTASAPPSNDWRLKRAEGREHQVRAYQDESNPLRYVVSTEVEDRYGDVVVGEGWKLANFRRNPIALYQHNSAAPIGTWTDIRSEGGVLSATLQPAAAGTSPIVDTVRALIEQKILRAASVGFRAIKVEPIGDTDGLRFVESELLEISLVSVPANPQALAIAKAARLSAQDQALLFAASGDPQPRPVARSNPGASAVPRASNDGAAPMKLAERITLRETDLVTRRDRLAEVVNKDNPDEGDLAQIETLPDEIDEIEKSLASLKRAQQSLAVQAQPVSDTPASTPTQRASTPATVRSSGRPADLLIRSAIIAARAHAEREPLEAILKRDYGENRELATVVRAVTNPATTTTAGWAAELVDTVTGDFFDVIRPDSIWAQLSLMRLNFDRGKIRLPSRSGRGLNGDFVAEGAPIPVRQTVLTSTLLEPYKLGVITTLTRELAKYSNPAAEPLFRGMMIGDTAETIDTLFLDANPKVATLRPAGLQALATGANTRVSSGTALANIITDLKALYAGLTLNGLGTRPVWIMHTSRLMSLQMATNAAGNFQFRDELARGTLFGYPYLASTIVPSAVVYLVEQSAMATASDSSPEIDVSDQATLHMESVAATVPPGTGTVAPIVDAAGLTAKPVNSMFQTYSMALRLVWSIDWAVLRTGAVQTLTGVAW